MTVPSTTINGDTMYLASTITRSLGFSDASVYLKKFVSPENRVLTTAKDFGVQGAKAWAINVPGIKQLIDNSKVCPAIKASMERQFIKSEKKQTMEQAISSRPEVVMELAKRIKKIKDDNYRLEVLTNNINNLLKECDEILKR